MRRGSGGDEVFWGGRVGGKGTAEEEELEEVEGGAGLVALRMG